MGLELMMHSKARTRARPKASLRTSLKASPKVSLKAKIEGREATHLIQLGEECTTSGGTIVRNFYASANTIDVKLSEAYL